MTVRLAKEIYNLLVHQDAESRFKEYDIKHYNIQFKTHLLAFLLIVCSSFMTGTTVRISPLGTKVFWASPFLSQSHGNA